MLNRKGEELLGYKEEELLGKNWFKIDILPEELREKKSQYFLRLATSKELSSEVVEHYLISKNGDRLLFTFHNSLLLDNKGNFIGVLNSGMNITELKKAQESLQHQAEHDA